MLPNKSKYHSDKKFILNVIKEVSKLQGKRLAETEIKGCLNYIKKIDFNAISRLSYNDKVKKISGDFNKILTPHRKPVYNHHEAMKELMGLRGYDSSSVLSTKSECNYDIIRYNKGNNNTKETMIIPEGKNTKNNITNNKNEFMELMSNLQLTLGSMLKSNPDNYNNVYFLLDSYYRNLSTDNSVFNWSVNYGSNTSTQGSVNTLDTNIKNIMYIQFDRSSIPYLPSADNIYNKISLEIEEFNNSSVILNSGRRYHLLFDSEIDGNRINLSPSRNDDGTYRFTNPIRILNSFTIKFRSPFEQIIFNKDRYNVIISSINATQSLITFTEDHGVNDGELVYITEFTTNAPTTDAAIIDTVNSDNGYIVTFISNTTLRIEVNTSGATLSGTHQSKCFIATRRVIIPIRIGYQLD